MNRISALGQAFVALAIIVGCAGRPQLEPRIGGNPQGVDLSGSWELRQESGKPLNDIGTGEQSIIIPPANSRRGVQRPRRSDDSAVNIFIESGNALKITQTDFGLFVSFDRAIVEEFTFGENRLVSVGPIEAQRVTGWNGRTLIVETLDEKGAHLTEAWSLAENGSMLVREIRVTEGEEAKFSTRQVFDRR